MVLRVRDQLGVLVPGLPRARVLQGEPDQAGGPAALLPNHHGRQEAVRDDAREDAGEREQKAGGERVEPGHRV